MTAHLSHFMVLHPSDLILTGSQEKQPFLPGQKKGVQPGQVVMYEMENLGRQENRVEEQAGRQQHEP